MFRVNSEFDRKVRIISFLIVGTTLLFLAGFNFYMAFLNRPNNITLFSVGITLIFLAISIPNFWAAWKFFRVPVTPPHS